jgi:Aspartyl protease
LQALAAPAEPSVAALLAKYRQAAADPGAAPDAQLETAGTIVGSGLNGSFHVWVDGRNARADQNLGPRSETTLELGDRAYLEDANGDVRELRGVLLRRARTERFIESGDFALEPQRCSLAGASELGNKTVYLLDVSAENGEKQTLYLDAATGLPARVAYDDDDGRTTIDLSDWRTVDGRRFPFDAVASDGDHAFDQEQRTEWLVLDKPIDPAVFALAKSRRIDMAGSQTIALTQREGHLFVPVTIAGKTYEFLIDSGAQNILLEAAVAKDLGLVTTGALEVSGAQRTGGLQLAKLPALTVGNGTLHDLVVTTLDLGRSTGGAFHVDGILGYPFFAQTLVTLDPAGGTMTFGPPGSFAPPGERIAIETDRALPEAVLRLDDSLSAPFMMDTGNAGELLLYRPFVEAHPGIVPFTLTSRRSYGVGGAAASYRSSLDRLDLAHLTIYHADTDVMQATRGAFADRFDAGNVGLGVLKNFIFTFDESNNAMYVARGAAFDDGRNRP